MATDDKPVPITVGHLRAMLIEIDNDAALVMIPSALADKITAVTGYYRIEGEPVTIVFRGDLEQRIGELWATSQMPEITKQVL